MNAFHSELLRKCTLTNELDKSLKILQPRHFTNNLPAGLIMPNNERGKPVPSRA